MKHSLQMPLLLLLALLGHNLVAAWQMNLWVDELGCAASPINWTTLLNYTGPPSTVREIDWTIECINIGTPPIWDTNITCGYSNGTDTALPCPSPMTARSALMSPDVEACVVPFEKTFSTK
ncbi:hypothetical protein F5Y16DRAFT_398585 [Xylariaceae sp. FL0255]|nr:hypothetical protein F5Y16DRAFT_398585 [Xylariaceae sp. FL0255]